MKLRLSSSSRVRVPGLKLNRLVQIDLNSDAVLVRRDVAEAQLAKNTGGTVSTDLQPPPPPPPPPPPARPRRFYAKVTLDPNRPTPQVSNIAQSILSELDRARGTNSARPACVSGTKRCPRYRRLAIPFGTSLCR
jgi:hypothetical protein